MNTGKIVKSKLAHAASFDSRGSEKEQISKFINNNLCAEVKANLGNIKKVCFFYFKKVVKIFEAVDCFDLEFQRPLQEKNPTSNRPFQDYLFDLPARI